MQSESNQKDTSDKQNGLLNFDGTNVSLSEFLEKLLEFRFPNDRYKQEVDMSNFSAGKVRFSCPYCGDSDKSSRKKRGNIYLKSKTYKCFNDKCQKYVSLRKFFGHFARKYSLIPPSIIMDNSKVEKEYVKEKSNIFLDFLNDENMADTLIKLDEAVFRLSLKRADQLSTESRVFQYLKDRRVTDTKDYGDYVYADPSDNKAYIINYDKDSGKILGFATRNLDPVGSMKYKIVDYTPLKKLFRVYINEEQLLTVNFMNNYFNLLNIDLDSPVTFVEGQFDSMFVQNCAAVSGISKTKAIFDNFDKVKMKILFDNDHAGRKQMMKLAEEGYKVFMWSQVIHDLKGKYPLDTARIRKIKDVNDLYCYVKKQDPKLSILAFNEYLNKYYSRSTYDLFFV